MKKILMIVAVLFVVGGGYGWYLYNKPVANTRDLKADFALTADDLFEQFDSNETEANSKYLGKIIEVNGMVREFSIGDSGELNLIMGSKSPMFGINCGMSQGQDINYKNYKVGDTISVKGECSGISLDVVLTRCVIVK